MNTITKNDSVYKMLGASNHCTSHARAEHDFYATDPKATKQFLELETLNKKVWEPACGDGAISRVLENYAYQVKSTDKYYHGYGEEESFDFLVDNLATPWEGDIMTNPPYARGQAEAFARKALDILQPGHKLVMFLRLNFLEGKGRQSLFDSNPPKRIYVSRSRLRCAINGDFEHDCEPSSIAYCWFVWEKGWHGHPEVYWFN